MKRNFCFILLLLAIQLTLNAQENQMLGTWKLRYIRNSSNPKTLYGPGTRSTFKFLTASSTNNGVFVPGKVEIELVNYVKRGNDYWNTSNVVRKITGDWYMSRNEIVILASSYQKTGRIWENRFGSLTFSPDAVEMYLKEDDD